MEEGKTPKKPKFLKVLSASSLSFSCIFLEGTIMGQSNLILLDLTSNGSPIKIDDSTSSWIVSVSSLGTLISALLCGLLVDRIGRVTTIRIFLIIFAISNIVLGFSNSLRQIIIGRILSGVAKGFMPPASVYLSEISDPCYRTGLLGLASSFEVFGVLFSFSTRFFLSWKHLSFILVALSMIILMLTPTLPEPASWLFKAHREEDAIKSVKWFKGDDCDVKDELKILEVASYKKPNASPHFLRKFTSGKVIKPFLILLAMMFSCNASGLETIINYMDDFIGEFQLEGTASITAAGMVVTMMLAAPFSLWLFQNFGVKTVGAITGFSLSLCLALLSVMVFLKKEVDFSTFYSNAVPILLFLVVFSGSLGIATVPYIIMYEMYPLRVRGTMCAVSYVVEDLMSFVFLKCYFVFISNLRLEGTILLYSVSAFAFALLTRLGVWTETHGLTLEEIGHSFSVRKKSTASAGNSNVSPVSPTLNLNETQELDAT